jgi:hypothetical protein
MSIIHYFSPQTVFFGRQYHTDHLGGETTSEEWISLMMVGRMVLE